MFDERSEGEFVSECEGSGRAASIFITTVSAFVWFFFLLVCLHLTIGFIAYYRLSKDNLLCLFV